jgi:uncharacterized protein (DUF433 family)
MLQSGTQMAATTTGYQHITVASSGVPVIAGTGYRVVPIIEQYKARGWSAEELHTHYLDLTPAQLHSLLAYYYDHAGELDAELRQRAEAVEAARRETPRPPVAERLRALRSAGTATAERWQSPSTSTTTSHCLWPSSSGTAALTC